MSTEKLIAAIDQGSSSTKGALITENGRRVAEISVPIDTRVDGDSVHHRPEEIAASVETVLERLLDTHQVAAIGLTCQRSTSLLWHRESGEALSPALSWQDTSQSGQARDLSSHAEWIAYTTGLRLSPHYAATKLASLIAVMPNGRRRAEAGELVAGTLDAFLVRQLTGEDGTEPGHAGRTFLLDLESGTWNPDLADLFGIPLVALPRIRPSAGHWGTYRGIPLTAVAGDQQAALVGHGGWNEGVVAAHFGTGAFVLAGTGASPLRLENALSAFIATADSTSRFQIEASVNSAGSAVDWARRLSGENLEDWRERPLDPDKLPLVFPAFRGTGAPWWRPEARPVISGLDIDQSGEQILGGVLAGVAMRVVDCIELLGQAVTARSLRVSGKLTRLSGLTALIADASGLPVEVAEDEEVGLLGIARLARAGLDESEHHLTAPPPLTSRREPEWSADHAAGVRRRWLRFSRAALELGSDIQSQSAETR
jgi:glycerol kinase